MARWMLCCVWLFASVWAGAVEPDVDPLALATRLLADGYADRAVVVLEEVDPDPAVGMLAPEDRSRFFMLRGLAHLRNGLPEAAIDDLQRSVAEPGADVRIHLQLAQVLVSQRRFEEALSALDAAGDAAEAVPGGFLLRARAAQELGDAATAWVALVQGGTRFPDEVNFRKQRVFLLITQGLYQAALHEGRALVEEGGQEVSLFLAMGDALRNAGELDRALTLLEEARLRFPLESKVYVLLGRTYLDLHLPARGRRATGGRGRARPHLVRKCRRGLSAGWRAAGARCTSTAACPTRSRRPSSDWACTRKAALGPRSPACKNAWNGWA